MKPWLVIGIGNAFRADDAAGLEVARELARRPAATASPGIMIAESHGEPFSLLEQMHGFNRVVLVDAIDAGLLPGTVRRYDVSDQALPALSLGTSTHALGLGEAIELARSLGRLPSTTLVFGIQAGIFDTSTRLSAAVRRAVVETADLILAELLPGAVPPGDISNTCLDPS